MTLTDEQIAALTPAERRDLILRLLPRPDGLPSARTINRIRKWRTALPAYCSSATPGSTSSPANAPTSCKPSSAPSSWKSR
ncbi:hypothetical protein [Kribbella albertanoniae]|uniref:Uncharacterized protein n=1 Tax=Kribbella albertanoniae TaxID=1266829 RepID=A0A4R4PLX7_9ACTN|nr:hypothetical protein [Kribbella albertanoniae]TDC23009.1 hypothetical protein E1261_29570 [Kribbella albertanoniae]